MPGVTTPTVSDSFTSTGVVPLGSHLGETGHGWTRLSVEPGTAIADGGIIGPGDSVYAEYLSSADPGTPEQQAETDFAFSVEHAAIFLTLRATQDGTRIRGGHDNGEDRWVIQEFVDNVIVAETQIAAFPEVGPHTLKLVASLGVARLFLDGVRLLRHTITAVTQVGTYGIGVGADDFGGGTPRATAFRAAVHVPGPPDPDRGWHAARKRTIWEAAT